MAYVTSSIGCCHCRQCWNRRLAAERSDEGTSVQLACLVLAQHCLFEAWGDRGGPTPEMVELAENTAGEYLDERFAKEGTACG